jgi:BlaI family penicillinase repressor
LTGRELQIMGVLWSYGLSSVREIQVRLPSPYRPAYTTVQTMVYRLEAKKAVRRLKKIGNAHMFEATISRRAMDRQLIDGLLLSLGCGISVVLERLIDSGRMTLDDIRHAEAALRGRQRTGGRCQVVRSVRR